MAGKLMVFSGLALVAGGSLLAGCGSSNAGSQVKPDELSGSAALGGGGCGTAGVSTPLVVDMPDRAFLEGAMQDGVVFLNYDCKVLTVLPDCTLPGDYAYRGLSRQEEIVALENQDEVSANMPFSSGSAAGKLESGNVLNIGLVSIGRRSTAAQVARDQLVGAQCAQATHYLKQAVLGAFAMKTAERGAVSGAVDVFAVASAGASSTSTNSRDRKDGDLEACRTAKSSDDGPPEQCQAILRLMLTPIPNALPVKAKGEEVEEDAGDGDDKGVGEAEVCAKGLVFVDGKCGLRKAGQPTVCEPTNSDDCLKQCEAGNAKSCHFYGLLLYGNLCKDPSKKAHCDKVNEDGNEAAMGADERKSLDFFKKACEAGLAEGCYEFGSSGESFWKEDEELLKQGVASYDKACEMGLADACSSIAFNRLGGRSGVAEDTFKGLSDLDRACKLGDTYSCLELGGFYFTGKHVSKDPQRGYNFLKQFCDQGNTDVCLELGQQLLGTYIGSDLNRPTVPAAMTDAEKLGRDTLDKGCKKNDPYSCGELGRVLYVAKEYEQARLYLEASLSHSKNSDFDESEILLGDMFFEGKGVPANKSQGVTYWISSEDDDRLLKAAGILESGKGVIKDAEKAGVALGLFCESTSKKKECLKVKSLNVEAFKKAMASVCDEDYVWACEEHKGLDLEGHKAYLKESCGEEFDPDDFFCQRLQSLQ